MGADQKALPLLYSGSPVTGISAAGDFNTDSLQMSLDHMWELGITVAGLDGAPQITVQCSSNGTDWVTYSSLAENLDISSGAVIFDRDFIPSYFRVAFAANGNTTGTVSMTLKSKVDR